MTPLAEDLLEDLQDKDLAQTGEWLDFFKTAKFFDFNYTASEIMTRANEIANTSHVKALTAPPEGAYWMETSTQRGSERIAFACVCKNNNLAARIFIQDETKEIVIVPAIGGICFENIMPVVGMFPDEAKHKDMIEKFSRTALPLFVAVYEKMMERLG